MTATTDTDTLARSHRSTMQGISVQARGGALTVQAKQLVDVVIAAGPEKRKASTGFTN